MMSIVLLMTALMPAVYTVLIDSSYAEGILYVPVLLLAMYFQNISGFYGGIFTAHKDTNIMGTTTIVSALLCLVLTLSLTPIAGLWGASLASLAATSFVNEYRRRKVAQYAKLREDYREAACTLIGIVIVFVTFYVFVWTKSLLALFVGIAAALAYSIALNYEMLKASTSYIVRVVKRH